MLARETEADETCPAVMLVDAECGLVAARIPHRFAELRGQHEPALVAQKRKARPVVTVWLRRHVPQSHQRVCPTPARLLRSLATQFSRPAHCAGATQQDSSIPMGFLSIATGRFRKG